MAYWSSQPLLKIGTLVTCEDAAATYRTIVKGTLETSVDYSKAPKDILEAFTESYNQMQL